ncbi:hypothetical protein JAAARDRAFT_169182 [Jaapia argillacea MUCL 33604]|uniref:Glucose receptor Git3 N-terminal domain-containing protein n=1 Tax=Jaapia argillacea MUCL 33604 TaxID=933084 RepID=A0A067QL99_9AGAM|nr:hypothetical protein JAAARDRAFT_169182 [Jaapia argillacea MUCL 33604]
MASSGAEPFTFGERLGIVFIVESACLSAAAVTSLLCYIGYGAIRAVPETSGRWRTGTHIHWYFLSLMVSDLIQAIGSILNIRWVSLAGVNDGPYCTTQGRFTCEDKNSHHTEYSVGVMKQLGDVGVAFATLAIALHTFCVLALRWKPDPSPRMAIMNVTLIWIFLALLVGLSLGTHKGKDYYGDTQFWCWITQDYPVQRIALEYFWLWFTAFLNIALYVPLALVLGGFIIIDGFKIRIPNKEERGHLRVSSINGTRDARHLSMKMLFYPAVYTITVLPIAIVRWSAFYNHPVPFEATVFADALFSSSGLLNVLLFSITRPALLHRNRTSRTTIFETVVSDGSDSHSGEHRRPVSQDIWRDSAHRLSTLHSDKMKSLDIPSLPQAHSA